MDRRLVLELLPGIAFLIGNAMGDLLWGAGAAVLATALAVALRWRWDGRLPWLAVATLLLTFVLTGASLVLRDAAFITLRPTIGALAFAALVGAGALARPPLLRRSLGYRLHLTGRGWSVLHGAWIAAALLSALANEIARRALEPDGWALFNALSDPALFALVWLATRTVAERHWNDAGSGALEAHGRCQS